MAWSTCPYCQKRVNGSFALEGHLRRNHPVEYALSEAQEQVGWAEEHLSRHIKDKEEYETLDTLLAQPDLPDLAVSILTKERDKRLIQFYLGKNEWGTVPFDEEIAVDTKHLAEKRAELDAVKAGQEERKAAQA